MLSGCGQMTTPLALLLVVTAPSSASALQQLQLRSESSPQFDDTGLLDSEETGLLVSGVAETVGGRHSVNLYDTRLSGETTYAEVWRRMGALTDNSSHDGTLGEASALQHGGEDCWTACASKSGFCDYCGKGNACCRRGDWKGDAIECSRAVSFKGAVGERHECVAIASARDGNCAAVHLKTSSTQRFFADLSGTQLAPKAATALRAKEVKRYIDVKRYIPQTRAARSNLPFLHYVYELPSRLNVDLLACYEKENNVSVFHDERKERAQNTADVWMHQNLLDHPNRTMDPKLASMFYIPFYGALSTHFSGSLRHGYNFCNGVGHPERVQELALFLLKSPYFQESWQQEQHAMTVSYWGVTAKRYPHWETWSDSTFAVITGPLRPVLSPIKLLVYEPKFLGYGDPEEWKNYPATMIPIPYVADHRLIESEHLPQRRYSLYFRGNLELDSSNKTSGIASKGQETRCLAYQSARRLPGALLVDSSTSYSPEAYLEEMRHSSFCLVPRGDTPSSRRLFDAIQAGCVPVIVADEIALPFEDFLDWSLFSVRIKESEVENVHDLLGQLSVGKVRELHNNLKKARFEFLYGIGSPMTKDRFRGHATANVLRSLHESLPKF